LLLKPILILNLAIIQFHMMMTVDWIMEGLFMTAPQKVAKTKRSELQSLGVVCFALVVIKNAEGVLRVVNMKEYFVLGCSMLASGLHLNYQE